MNVQPTDRPSIVYYKLTTPADAAASVAEGGEKPESLPVLSPFTANVTKIAHRASMTDEVVADYAGFTAFLSNDAQRSGVRREQAIVDGRRFR